MKHGILLIAVIGLALCGCATVSQETISRGEKVRFEPDDSFPMEYRHRITEALTRHGFIVAGNEQAASLNCTAAFDDGFTRCVATIFLRREGRTIFKAQSANRFFPWARSAQENRIKAAIEIFDRQLAAAEKK